MISTSVFTRASVLSAAAAGGESLHSPGLHQEGLLSEAPGAHRPRKSCQTQANTQLTATCVFRKAPEAHWQPQKAASKDSRTQERWTRTPQPGAWRTSQEEQCWLLALPELSGRRKGTFWRLQCYLQRQQTLSVTSLHSSTLEEKTSLEHTETGHKGHGKRQPNPKGCNDSIWEIFTG